MITMIIKLKYSSHQIEFNVNIPILHVEGYYLTQYWLTQRRNLLATTQSVYITLLRLPFLGKHPL